jgi:HPt (histidine-containing phosphotransfer) domain-containing protein
MFADTTPPLLDELTQASQQEDRERLRRLAHKLKGSCESIGAARMAALCRALEASADDHARLVAELCEAYPATLTEIRAT